MESFSYDLMKTCPDVAFSVRDRTFEKARKVISYNVVDDFFGFFYPTLSKQEVEITFFKTLFLITLDKIR